MSVERVSPADLTELVCDVTGTSMQVAAVLVLDAGAPMSLATVRDALASRIEAIPRLRQRLMNAPFGCGRPVWIDDACFDIGDQVSVVGCAAPGGQQELLGVVARIVTAPLAPGRPLWSATLVTGLAAGRSALVVVFHHVLADGIGGLAVLSRLTDGSPVGPGPAFPREPPRPQRLFVDAFRSRWRAVGRLPAGLSRLRAAAAELGTGQSSGAPRCSLNRPIGADRALAVAHIDLAAIHAAARAQESTINDAVLAAVAGALRTVLADRGKSLDRLVVSMPVSSRRHASATDLGNQVGVLPVTIPTTGEATGRLAAVAQITRNRKTDAPGSSAAVLGPVFRVLARAGVFGWFINRQRLVNAFVSNLRGPERQLTFAGAPVIDMMAVPMITGNITVAFAALSYAGRLTVTVIADAVQCPDLPAVAHALQQELDLLTGSELPIKAGTG